MRHGESEGNAERRFTYSPEVPLSELGHAQARRTGLAIRDRYAPARLYASPFRRAQQTAEIIAEINELSVETEPDLREQHPGELHGLSYDSVVATKGFGELPRWEWRPPGEQAESLVDLQRRAAPVIERLARTHADVDVVIVSHGGTTQALWAYVEGSWDAIDFVPNCSLLVVQHDGTRFGRTQLFEAPEER